MVKALKNYRFIIADPDLLGGKPVIKGTRLSAAFVLSCLAAGMTADEIAQTYAPFPPDAIPEVLKLASEVLDARQVAA